jgi:hypothetical protein
MRPTFSLRAAFDPSRICRTPPWADRCPHSRAQYFLVLPIVQNASATVRRGEKRIDLEGWFFFSFTTTLLLSIRALDFNSAGGRRGAKGLTTLKDKAKTRYQRDYMRRKRDQPIAIRGAGRAPICRRRVRSARRRRLSGFAARPTGNSCAGRRETQITKTPTPTIPVTARPTYRSRCRRAVAMVAADFKCPLAL